MSRRCAHAFADGELKCIAALATLTVGLALTPFPLRAQSAASQSAPSSTPEQTAEPAQPTGRVLFSRSLDATAAADESQDATQPAKPNPAESQKSAAPTQDDALAVTDAERSALIFTAYDLDVHLTPASAGISVRTGLTLRNNGTTPLSRLVLQITSSMHWGAISIRSLPSGSTTPLHFAAHSVDTDADHTGQMSEAVVPLPKPLAPGASVSLTALYSGTILPSAERLERIGMPDDEALATDWDAVAGSNPDGQNGATALRGFGNVLWIPVSAPPVFLGDGARLFQAVGDAKLRQSTTTVRLRLAVEYVGDAPDAAFFCGQRQPFVAISDNANLPEAESPGVATATFDPQPLGFRTPSLFVAERPASETGTTANPALVNAVTSHYDALPAYAAAAALVEPLLTDWLGPRPLTSLSLIDHPGQPFEDDALLLRPMRADLPATLAPSLAHSLTHVWIHSTHPWIDEGLAQFVGLLWIERSAGRAIALAELQEAARSLALIEPEAPADSAGCPIHDSFIVMGGIEPGTSPECASATSSPSSSSIPPGLPTSAAPTVGPAGESLATATGEVFYRTKAAAVWWMLRGIVGDDELKQALQTYRLDPSLDRDPTGLEHTLEKSSHKDLRWFFDDWVYRDRGLPDLSIVSVTPSQLTSRAGLPAGWLVAVEIHNDGYAEAEVPVTVRSATAIETQRLRIPGRSSASTRIVFAGTPERVEVNDGSVPETQSSLHTRQLILPGS